MSLQRIVVVGTTGSGKTTLAGQLSERLDSPHIELDELNWGPNWTMRPDDVFRTAVDEATSGDRWVLDGNYSRMRDIVWSRADTIVWLDYPLLLILWRLWWRTLRRWYRREILWNNNRERLWEHFSSRNSLFLWALSTYKRRKRDYSNLLGGSEYSHLTVFHFHWPSQTNRWLASGNAGHGRDYNHDAL
jgi:adenylate kinase family enzyme